MDFRIPHRKNNQFLGDTVSVARPPAARGAYYSLREAKAIFASGFVLPHVGTDGAVDRTRAMSYSDFVRHLRAALVHVGVPEAVAREYAAHSMCAPGQPPRRAPGSRRTSSASRPE